MRRLSLFLLLLLTVSSLAGCGEKAHSDLPSGARRVALSEFPNNIGLGYPQGVLKEPGPPQMLRRGDAPPDFFLLLPDGRYTALSDLKGRRVLINFWATWCPPCRAEMPELLQAAQDYPDLVLLAVNVSEAPEAVSRFAEQFRMNAAVVLDPQGAISDRYNVRGLPTSVFLDASGLIQEVRPGAINRKVIDEILQRQADDKQ